MDIKHTNNNSINFRPSFSSTVSFSAVFNSFKFGDNFSQRVPNSINSLGMKAELSFDELTDNESQELVTFLQKQFYYEAQNYNNLGYFTNKRIIPFQYQTFYPYKNLEYNCLNFQHSRPHFNINNIAVSLTAIAPSSLGVTSVTPGVNTTIDGAARHRFSQNVHLLDVTNQNHAVFKKDNVLFLRDSYLHATVNENKSINKNNTSEIDLSSDFSEWRITEHIDFKQTNLQHSIFIDDPNECSEYPYLHNTTDGLLDCKLFNFRPNQSFTLQHSPKFKQTSLDSVYKKYNKYGFNPNLNNLSLTFSGLSNLEAKNILLFLESHLGYKKFGYLFHKNYLGNNSETLNTTPHKSTFSTFYCPEWSHTFVYHDNHEISATFMECPR